MVTSGNVPTAAGGTQLRDRAYMPNMNTAQQATSISTRALFETSGFIDFLHPVLETVTTST